MKLHFINTGCQFLYPYYLSILSALKVHKIDEIIFWTFNQPTNKYFDLIKDRLSIRLISMPDFPALKNKSEHFLYSKLKDYFGWKILYEEGGLYFDLDTFSVQDISSFIRSNKEIMAVLETEKIENWPSPFNTAVMAAKKGSSAIKEALNETEERLNRSEIGWGDIGPGLFSKMVKNNLEKAEIVDYGICGWSRIAGGVNLPSLYEDGEKVDPKIRLLHLFAYASKDYFEKINPDYIERSNSVYAQLVKKTLNKKNWKPFETPQGWIDYRGKHYQPMFDYLQNHECQKILEIGTHAGSAAIAMIKSSLVLEKKIVYFGFDFFKDQDEITTAKEFSFDYNHPPFKKKVEEIIRSKTKGSSEFV